MKAKVQPQSRAHVPLTPQINEEEFLPAHQGSRESDTTRQTDAGMTLLEAMAGVIIAAMVTLAAYAIESSAMQFYTNSGTKATRVADTMGVDWTLQKLAQVAVAAGTETASQNGDASISFGPTATPTHVLVLRVTSLDNIVPMDSPLYQAVGSPKDIELIPVPINGTAQLCLAPVGYNPALGPTANQSMNEVFAISNGQTDYTNTTFSVTGTGFQIHLVRNVSRVGAYAVAEPDKQPQLDLSFVLGSSTF